MKQYWERFSQKIDALSLRERAIIFLMAALMLVMLFKTALLDQEYQKQTRFSQQVTQAQSETAALQTQIQQKALAQSIDPDAANKAHLQQLKRQSAQMHHALSDMQKGLVSPDRMSALLEDMLQKNHGLRLVSLKTLPALPLIDSAFTDKRTSEGALAGRAPALAKSGTGDAPEEKFSANSIYRHGVEIVVEGRYLDIMNYLGQLESMPWQLFWSKAKLNADYPDSTLTLTLFTLSMDEKWLNL